MKIAFLYPGQGAQAIGMGKDFYDNFEEAREVYDSVKKITGIDIAKISFEGPEETLNQTKYTQLAILTMSLAISKVLENKGIKCDMSAGLSLGEYSALINSKVLSFEDGIRLVQKRGEYMQDLVPAGEWEMAAIMGMNEAQVKESCSKVTKGFAVPVNYNCVGQIVVSGEKEAVEEVAEIAKADGAKKVRVLKTSGPFHTEKLIESSKALSKELEKVEFKNFENEVVKNYDGEIYKETDDIKTILARHIVSPVRFSKSLNTMLENGVDTFIEVGPGKTLSGFVKRTPVDKEIKNLVINSKETLESVLELLK